MAKKKKKKITIEGLRKFNIFMFFFFALQAGILFLLASQKVKFPITTNYLTFDRATESLVSSSKTLFDLPLVWPIIAFVLICMFSHLLISTIWYRGYK